MEIYMRGTRTIREQGLDIAGALKLHLDMIIQMIT